MKSLLRKPMENYRGRHVGCVPGTHAGLVEMICRHMSPCKGVIDIGAHAGALLMRLESQGFDDFCGVDLDSTRFDVPGAEFKRVELNGPFSEAFDRQYHLITSTDVVEHLDSLRNFLTQARQLLDDDGYLALSFPNVAFWEGRFKFMLKGELWGFGDRNYRTQRHISPTTFEQMSLMMQELGFRVVEAGTAGSCATLLRRTILFPLWAPVRLFGGASTMGESTLFLAQKTEPDPDLKRPIHYRNRWKGIPDRIGIDLEK